MARSKTTVAGSPKTEIGSVWIEIDRPPGEQLASGSDDAIKAVELPSDKLDSIAEFSRLAIDRTTKSNPEIDEVTLEFGVKITGSVGAVIAKATTEGHCRVTIKWKRK